MRTIAEHLRQCPTEPLHLPAGASATVGDVMLRDIPTTQCDTPLDQALARLQETEKRCVVVVDDDNRVVGVMTDGDILRRTASHAWPGAPRTPMERLNGGTHVEGLEVVLRGRAVADVMTSPVVTVTADTPIAEAIRTLMAHRIKPMPVMDESGRLVGLVGRAGLLQPLSGHQENHADAPE